MHALSGRTIQVMLVDDHAMIRAGIKVLLEQIDGIDVVGEAANGFKAIELVKQLLPDVILMDLSMPGMDGIEAIQRILAIRPEDVCLSLDRSGLNNEFPAELASQLFLGDITVYQVVADGKKIRSKTSRADQQLEPGSRVYVRFPPEKLKIFPK